MFVIAGFADRSAAVGDIPVSTIALISKGLSVHGWPSGHSLDSRTWPFPLP